MNYKQTQLLRQKCFAAFFAGLLLLGQTFAQTAAAPAKLSASETELAANIKIETIKEITAARSADDMQGRGSMQPGGERAATYIADRFQKIGLKPLGDKNTFLQKIDFKETVFTPETTFKVGDEALKFGADYAFIPYSKEDQSASGDMVFIAYGIQAKAINRDDLQGVDVRGKVVVMLDGPPANVSKEAWEKGNAKFAIFGTLIRSGAAAIVLIPHGREKNSNEMIVDYLGRRQISMSGEGGAGAPFPIPPIVLASGKTAEKLFSKSGMPLKDALAQAEQENFKPFKLNQLAKIVKKSKTTKGTSSNVVGILEGVDPALKAEAIVFSAHYDAYGVENGKIYHGAADNALGVAEMIAVAEAYSKTSSKPRRSLIFLAVTGEEYGLYGSKYWAKNPTWKIKQVAADLNLDGIGTEVYAPVKTFVGFGAEHSTIGATLADVSGAFGIKVIADPMPDEKIFYRSDHYSFVEKGVPSLMLLGAPEGNPQKWIERSKAWEKTDYHQPNDVIQPDWAWEGAKTVADVMATMGWRISENPTMPEWLPSSRFAKFERGNSKEIPEEK